MKGGLMDYLKLGVLKLTVSDGVNGFDEKISYDYATHSIASGKSVLQSIGAGLSEINLSIELHSYLGQNITNIMSQIDRMCLGGTPQKLMFSNGVFKGDYVITERTTTVTRTDNEGNITSAKFQISLLEYADRVLLNTKNCEQKGVSDSSTTRKINN